MLTANSERQAELRERLANLSWFMFKPATGRPSSLVDAAARCSRRWFPGQDGGSIRLCVGHWLDAEP